MIDQTKRLKIKGKDFAGKIPNEVKQSFRRSNTIFTITSSENNHNTYFLKEFEKNLVGSMQRQADEKKVFKLYINVKGKDTLEDLHYKETNYNVLLKSVFSNYHSLSHQFTRLKKKDKYTFLLTGLGIVLIPAILIYSYHIAGATAPDVRDYLSYLVGLFALAGLFQFFTKQVKHRIEKIKKQDTSFAFEQEAILRKLNSRGFRRKPSVVLIDNAELLDEEPFRFLLSLMDTQHGPEAYGVLWVFLFATQSDNLDELIRNSTARKYANHLVELKPYNEEQIQEILKTDKTLRCKGNYLISLEEEKRIADIRRQWEDIVGKKDNQHAFTEYDILRIIAFSGTRHHIEAWNLNSIAELLTNAPAEYIQAFWPYPERAKANDTSYFDMASKLTQHKELLQNSRSVAGKYTIPFQLRLVMENTMDQKSLLLIQLFWIRKYLLDYEPGSEELLAKRILYRINTLKSLYIANSQSYDTFVLDIRTAITKMLDELFSNLSFRTFLQLFNALKELNDLIRDKDLTPSEKEKLAYYSTYLFELSGDTQFGLDGFFVQEKDLLQNKIMSIYKRWLSKEEPAQLLKDLESIQIKESLKEQTWLSNLYYLLVGLLRVRESDGFVFKLQKDISIAENLCPPIDSEFPVFEFRYRFLLLDIYMGQEKFQLFIDTFKSLAERLHSFTTPKLGLRVLAIYWRALAVHYWITIKKNHPEKPALQNIDLHSFFKHDNEIEDSHDWVRDQYVDAEFLFEQLELRLPLIDLFYSHARLIQQFFKPTEQHIAEWYADWQAKFKASIVIQHELGVSFNIPEIYARIFGEKSATMGSSKCSPEVKRIIEVLNEHQFNKRVCLYWRYKECAIEFYKKNYLQSRDIFFELIAKGKEQKGYLSYWYDGYETTRNDQIIEFYFRKFILACTNNLGEAAYALQLFNLLQKDFQEFRAAYNPLTKKEENILNDIELMIIDDDIELNPTQAIILFNDLKSRKDLISSIRFPNLLSTLMRLAPKNELDSDLIVYYLRSINETIAQHMEDNIAHEFLNIPNTFDKESYASLPIEAKYHIRKMVETVASSKKLIITTNYDDLEQTFGNLITCESSEPFYITQWQKWCELKIKGFMMERLDGVYNKSRSYEVFNIYLDFFKKYETDLPYQEYYPAELIQEREKIVEQFNTDEDPVQLAKAVLEQLRKNSAPMISGNQINRILWRHTINLSDFMHHLDEPEKATAKELLEDMYNPAMITDYLKIVQDIKSVPHSLKQVIRDLILKHEQNESKLRNQQKATAAK